MILFSLKKYKNNKMKIRHNTLGICAARELKNKKVLKEINNTKKENKGLNKNLSVNQDISKNRIGIMKPSSLKAINPSRPVFKIKEIRI